MFKRTITLCIIFFICFNVYSIHSNNITLSFFKTDEELNNYIEERIVDRERLLESTYEENRRSLEYQKENIDAIVNQRLAEKIKIAC